jgi:transposase
MIDKIHPGFAALDIGQEQIYIACAGEAQVRVFPTFSVDLQEAAKYLTQHGVTQVAMEATGVYWIPIHDLFEAHGLKVTVFNGAHARNLPGRKSDVSDCQWHAMLHSHGLLTPCFIVPEEIRQLRCFYRLREDHLSIAAAHVQHMQKALDLMNVRLHTVISQIHGVSGLRVIRAILAGERDPKVLVTLCDARIRKKKQKEVIKSLEGHWQEHHLFALRQAVEAYEFCHAQMAACDREIEQLLQRINAHKAPLERDPSIQSKPIRHNAPAIANLHSHLLTMTDGRDVTKLPGFTALGFMKLMGEIGPDLSAWPTVKHFTSWLGLSPGNSQSGKRRKKVPRKKTVAAQIFRESVMSIAKSKYLALGAFYRRLRARRGPAVAHVATARKLAEMFYHLMTKGLDYAEKGVEQYEAQYQEQTIRFLKKTAAKFGMSLVTQ